MSTKKKIRIAIYSRKSKYTDKGDSIGNQIELAKEYIKLHYPNNEYEAEIVIFEDEGFSGKSFDRPKLKEFLKEQKIKPFDVLICYRLDRISRNIADFSSLINELNEQGTSFVSIKEQFDTKTPMGRAMMYIASVFAQLEREVIAERVRDNLLELAKTGTWLGGDAPTGYKAERYQKVEVCEEDTINGGITRKSKKASKLVVSEEEKQKALLILRKYQELKSLTQLETYLINNNIKSRKGLNYSITSLRAILINPVYAQNDKDVLEYFREKGITVYAEKDGRDKFDGSYGLLSYNKRIGNRNQPINEWIIGVGLHKGLIPGKEWVNIQTLLEKNADKRYRAAGLPKKQSICSGIIKCKKCGSYMRPRNCGNLKKDGSVNYTYSCVLKEKSKGQKCDSKNIKGNLLDEKIIDIIKQTFVPKSEIYNELKKMSNKTVNNYDELFLLENEYKKINNEIDKVAEKIKFIDIDLVDMVNGELRKLKEKKEELENKISNLKDNNLVSESMETKTAKDILSIIDNSFNVFDTFDLKTKRDLANIFIESIEGNGEEVEINFLNTEISENQKKLFLSSNLPPEERSIYSHSSRCINNTICKF